MPSPKLRLLQDESVAIEKEITDLRSLEPKDDADRASIEERLNAAMSRAEKLTADAEREQELDARLASLQVVRNTSGSRAQVEQENRAAGGEDDYIPDLGAGVKAFRSRKAAAAVGAHFCRMAGVSNRAMGETSPTYNGTGSEYVIAELNAAIVNLLQYKSVAIQLASVYRPNAQTLKLPTSGNFTVGFAAEGAAFTDQDLTTASTDLTLFEGGGSVAVSNALLADSPIDVAGLIADRVAHGLAVWYDTMWLTGNGSNPTITGLPAAVSGGNTITVATGGALTTAANLADVVGLVDETIMGTGVWVASKRGYVDLMKIWSGQQTTMTVGGGRVLPTVFGAPVYIAKGMPSTTYALYGDFSKSTSIGLAADGVQITVAKELLVRNRQTLFVASTRMGLVNNGPSFVARLAKTP
jgi:HK97 family phage major capsid protein